MDRIEIRHLEADKRVAGLVIGGDLFLLVGDDHALALGTHHHLVFGDLKIDASSQPFVVTGGVESRFVDDVCKIGTL